MHPLLNIKIKNPHYKIFEQLLPVIIQMSKQCEILLLLILLGTRYESSFFLLLLKEGKAR